LSKNGIFHFIIWLLLLVILLPGSVSEWIDFFYFYPQTKKEMLLILSILGLTLSAILLYFNAGKNRSALYLDKDFHGINAGIVSGSKGIVPATANFIPHVYVKLYKACVSGLKNEAEKLFNETVFWSEIYQKGKTLGESLASLKFIMAELNLCPEYIMPPITEPENSEKLRIRNLIEKNRLKEKLGNIVLTK
jgi:hypothetical protein